MGGVALLTGAVAGIGWIVAGHSSAPDGQGTQAQALGYASAAVMGNSIGTVLAEAGNLAFRARAQLDSSAGGTDERVRMKLAVALDALDVARQTQDADAIATATHRVRSALEDLERVTLAEEIARLDAAHADEVAASEAAQAAAAQDGSAASSQQQPAVPVTDVRPLPPTTVRSAPDQRSGSNAGGAVVAPTVPEISKPTSGDSPAPPASPAVQRVTGSLLVKQKVNAAITGACGGYGRFADFQNGTQVVVTDASGRAVGSGQLANCQWQDAGFLIGFGTADYRYYDALYTYSVEVPEGASAYTIRIGWQTWESIAEVDLRSAAWKHDLVVS